jgi:hypothetical protein
MSVRRRTQVKGGSPQMLVRVRMRELGLSYEGAAARSAGLVSHGTLHRLASGLHQGRLREGTVQGVALALDLPQSAARDVLPVSYRPRDNRFVSPPRADRLSGRDRRLILDHVDRSLAKERE